MDGRPDDWPFANRREELIWAAALFEGEGTVYLSHGRYVRVVVEMTDEDTVRRYALIVAAKVLGPYERRGNGGKSRTWVAPLNVRTVCEALLADFYPFLGERRRARAKEVVSASRALW